jgi:2-dehydropantoate 2-reductase
MNKDNYKIGIMGLGPVGLTLACHLKEAGCQVFICDIDKDKVTLIRNEGVELVGTIEKKVFFNHVFTSVEELLHNKIDILISSIKVYHVEPALEHIDENILSDMFLLIAQNGIDLKEKYSTKFNDSQILRMVINYAGNLNAPNVVNVTFFNPPNYVASVDDTHPEVAEWISEKLNSVKLDTVSKDSFMINDKVWEKTILNAALSPLCAISKLTMREAMAHPDTLEIVEQIILEAIAVAKVEEIKLSENFLKLCIRYLKNGGDHFPSLAVDLLSKNETEIDYFNGKIVEYGRKHYIRTPLNLTFTNLVRAISHKNSQATRKETKTDNIEDKAEILDL